MDVNPPPPSDSGRPRGRGLGRGLSALIPGAARPAEPGITEIPVDRIRPSSRQPRAEANIDGLSDLIASIRQHGVLQPVLVRPVETGYEIIAGERRWRAAVAAGLFHIPAVVRRLDDRASLEAALVENLQREDLNPLDRARAYRRLADDFGLSQDDIARRVGLSQPTVANTLRLLSLPEEIQRALETGRVSEGHARALLMSGELPKMLALWRMIEERGLSVRQTEQAARRASISREIRRRGSSSIDLSIIQQSVSDKLGTPVRIMRAGYGGQIRITFYSLEDLDRLLEIFGVRMGGPA